MAQYAVVGGGSQALTSADTAIVRKDAVERHAVTLTAGGAATLTLTDKGDGYLRIATSAAVTVAVAA